MRTYKDECIRLINKSTEDPNAKIFQIVYTVLIEMQNFDERVDKNRMYTIMEACKVLNISRRTMYRYIESGKVKAVKTGRDWRFSQAEIERLQGR